MMNDKHKASNRKIFAVGYYASSILLVLLIIYSYFRGIGPFKSSDSSGNFSWNFDGALLLLVPLALGVIGAAGIWAYDKLQRNSQFTIIRLFWAVAASAATIFFGYMSFMIIRLILNSPKEMLQGYRVDFYFFSGVFLFFALFSGVVSFILWRRVYLEHFLNKTNEGQGAIVE